MSVVVYVDFLRSANNIGQLLQSRAQSYPHLAAIHSFKEDKTISNTLDYGTLHQRAKTMAAMLQQIVPAGVRVILMYQNDVDYVCALFACFYSGVTAVPVLPVKNRKEKKRLGEIITQSNACLLMTNQYGMACLGESFWSSRAAKNVWPMLTDYKVSFSIRGFHDRHIDPEMAAIIDYSSVTQDNAMPYYISHQELLKKALDSENNFNSVVSWLTPFTSQEGSVSGLIRPDIPCAVTELKMVR